MKSSCLPYFKKLLSELRSIIALALLLPLMALGLQGCSTLRLAYGNAPTAAYWYLDGYFDFSDAQSPAVRAALTQIHRWHQQTQLPAYVQTLQSLQSVALQDISTEQACKLYTQVQATLFETTQGMAERIEASLVAGAEGAPVRALLATLDTQQLGQLQRKLDKGNAEYRKKFMEGSPQKVLQRRLARMNERAEMLYGTLDASQKERLANRLTQSGYRADLAFSERLRRQQDLLQALRTSAGNSVMVSASTHTNPDSPLKAVVYRWKQSPDAVYRQQSESLRLHHCETMALLHNSTNTAQRQHAHKVLAQYAQDLQGFAKL